MRKFIEPWNWSGSKNSPKNLRRWMTGMISRLFSTIEASKAYGTYRSHRRKRRGEARVISAALL
jgi:hypothetical protein